MEIAKALYLWESISYEYSLEDEKTDEAYWIYFTRKNKRVGYVKVVSQKITCNYPKELLDLQNKKV